MDGVPTAGIIRVVKSERLCYACIVLCASGD